jgi:anthranilate 1,2-dioxygenase large subunit
MMPSLSEGAAQLGGGIAGAGSEYATPQMGGDSAGSSESRVTEASVRGFWKAYRAAMGFVPADPAPDPPEEENRHPGRVRISRAGREEA